jgi:hypothetical protein
MQPSRQRHSARDNAPRHETCSGPIEFFSLMVATGRNHAGAGAPDWTYRRWLGAVRILFGLIWLANTVLQANPATSAHFIAMMAA